MKIGDLLVKPTWRRRQPPKSANSRKKSAVMTEIPMAFDTGSFIEYTQSDFLNELHPSSHLINSVAYRSERTKYKYNIETKKNEPDGLEEVERIAVAIQEGLRRHKRTHTFGNDMWFGSEGGGEDNDALVALHRSHWNMTGMTDALSSWGGAMFGTGDAALYLYREGNKINYKVFSYENGDVFTMRKDKEGKDLFVRLFLVNGARAVELYGSKDISLWVQEKGVTEEVIITPEGAEVNVGEWSEDGYRLISRVSHGSTQCPVIYHRRSDVVWGPGQSTIEHIEKLLSDLGENNKYYAYQILFLSGGVMTLPDVGSMGKVIASKTKEGDAKILQPADASNTFTVDLEKNLDLLWECTATVVIEPKELKAGENTGAFIKNLYWREVQWSTNEIADLRPSLSRIVSVFSEYVGMIEGKTTEFSKLKMSFLLEPFVPKNLTEEITNICTAKGYGLTSVRTGSGEIYFNNPREYELIKKEEAEALAAEMKKAADLAAQKPAETTVPIDNKAKS